MMERKPAAGSIRNKERSKKKFLDAVGQILMTKGCSALKINDIAATAGLDKKMIYTYFGGTEGLLDAYIQSQDFWSNVKVDPSIPIGDGGKVLTQKMLQSQFDYVYKNKELQKLLLWRLSEKRTTLKKLSDRQEANGEYLFSTITDPHFKAHSEQYRAVIAILISGIYYLNLYSNENGSVFCGLDMKSPQDRDKIKEALSFIIDSTYKKYE